MVAISADEVANTTKSRTLSSNGRTPVRYRKVSIAERNKLFDDYVSSRNRTHDGSISLPTTTHTFHGTPQVEAASSIARIGPCLKRAGSNIGVAYGRGFYSDKDPVYPESVAGRGSVLALSVAPARSTLSANSSTKAASLASQGFDSVAVNGWHILFHPDAV